MKHTIDFSEHTRDWHWFAERLNFDGARIIDKRDVLCRCPAHDDYSPSLHLREDDQGLLVHCFAGCSRAEIEDALEDAAPRKSVPVFKPQALVRGNVVASYVYSDVEGRPIYRKRRFEPKSFDFQRAVWVPERREGPVQHDAYCSWQNGLKDREGNYLAQPIPYNLNYLAGHAYGRDSSHVMLVDGEKDADVLMDADANLVATCSPYGMANWWDSWSLYLAHKRVTVVADRDDPGYAAASRVAQSLREIGKCEIRMVEAVEGKDAFDHLEAGYGVDEFRVIDG